MGFRTELYLQKEAETIFIGEGNNGVPYFWSAVFANHHFDIGSDSNYEDLELCIQHKIEPSTDIEHDFERVDKSVAEYWKDFLSLINKHLTEGYQLHLYLGDILLMDSLPEQLETSEMIRKKCRQLFEDTNSEFLERQTEHITFDYTAFLGASFQANHSLNDFTRYSYFTEQSVSDEKRGLNWRLFPKILGLSLLSLSSAVLCLGGALLIIFDREKWKLGILAFVLFGGCLWAAWTDLRKTLALFKNTK